MGGLQLLTEAIEVSVTLTYYVVTTITRLHFDNLVTCTCPLSSVCAIFIFNDSHLCFLSGRLDINPVTLCHKAYESHIIICTDPDAMM